MSENSLQIDWFSMSVRGISIDEFVDIVGINETYEKREYGKYSYMSSLKFENIRIYYDGRGESEGTIFLDLSSKGVSDYELFANESILELAKRLKERATKYNVPRIDVAIDQKGEYDKNISIKPATVKKKIDNGEAKRNFRRYRYVTNDEGGKTLYLGSETSDLLIRIYDKRAERIAKLVNVPEKIAELPDHWTRFELQYRNTKAVAVLEKLIENNLDRFVSKGLLRDSIHFPQWRNWTSFMKDIEAIKIRTRFNDTSYEEKREHWIKQNAKGFMRYVEVEAEAHEESFLDMVYLSAESRMKQKDILEIQNQIKTLTSAGTPERATEV